MSSQVKADHDVGYYVYGIVPADAVLPPTGGLDGAELELVPLDDIAAVVSRFALDRPAGRKAELMAHRAVVDALAEAGPVVPVQFGAVLEHATAAVQELLADQGPGVRESLDHLRDRLQLNLRVRYVEEQVLQEVVSENPRIAELHRRTRRLAEGEVHPDLVELGELVHAAVARKRVADTDLVLEAVHRHPVDVVERRGDGLDHVVDLALLVPLSVMQDLEQTLEDHAEQTHGRLRWRLVGPMAPYDFAGEPTWG